MNNMGIFQKNLHKTFFQLALPSIAGMLLISLQIMIDGIFIGNYMGPDALAAVNISMPYIDLVISFVIMISIGGSVVTSILKGSGNHKKYIESFSFVSYIFIAFSIFIMFISLLFKKKIIYFLGANASLFPLVDDYLTVFILLSFLFSLPIFLETYTRIAEKPNLIFISSLLCLVSNIFFDYIFLDKFGMGMKGAAAASCIANALGGIFLYYYMIGRDKAFYFVSCTFDRDIFKNIIYNGSSEMFGTLSASICTYIFNIILMKNIGQSGVTAFTVILYTNAIIRISLYGLAQALQPIISYNLGAGNIKNIYKVLKIALISGALISVFFYMLMNFYGESIISMFIKDNPQLKEFTRRASDYYIVSYMFLFVNIIMGTYHTSIERAFESIMIAVLHSVVLVALFLYILPPYLGDNGIWLAVPFAEASCIFVSLYFFFRSRKTLEKLQPCS